MGDMWKTNCLRFGSEIGDGWNIADLVGASAPIFSVRRTRLLVVGFSLTRI